MHCRESTSWARNANVIVTRIGMSSIAFPAGTWNTTSVFKRAQFDCIHDEKKSCPRNSEAGVIPSVIRTQLSIWDPHNCLINNRILSSSDHKLCQKWLLIVRVRVRGLLALRPSFPRATATTVDATTTATVVIMLSSDWEFIFDDIGYRLFHPIITRTFGSETTASHLLFAKVGEHLLFKKLVAVGQMRVRDQKVGVRKSG